MPPPCRIAHQAQQEARETARWKGILPYFKADISIGGKTKGGLELYDTVELHERCDGHHSFSIRYGQDHPKRPDNVDIQEALAMVGKTIGISIHAANIPGTKRHGFNGIVTRAYKDFNQPPYGHIIVEGYSTTYLIDNPNSKTLRSWNTSNLSKVVNDVLEPLRKYHTNTVVTPAVVQSVNYIQQHQETGYNFIRRIARNFGEEFYFDGVNLCFGKPRQPDSTIKVVQGEDVYDLKINFELRAVGQSQMSYDLMSNENNIQQAPDSIKDMDGLAGQIFQQSKDAFGSTVVNAPFEASSTPGMLETDTDDDGRCGQEQGSTHQPWLHFCSRGGRQGFDQLRKW